MQGGTRAARGNLRATATLFAVAFFLFYFGQKVGNNYEGVSKIPVREALKAFGLPADQIGSLMTSISVGWYIKALLGVVTDGLPIFGYRRRPWLLISNLFATAWWLWLGFGGGSSPAMLAFGLTMVNIGVAFADVVVDGLMVQSAQKLEAAEGLPDGTLTRSFQGWQWAGAGTAIVLASILGGVIAAVANVQLAALISAGTLILLLPVIFLAKEDKVEWNWTEAKRGVLGVVLAVLVGGFYLWSNGLAKDHWLQPGLPYLQPLVVIGSMLLVVRLPMKLLAPVALIFLWQTTPMMRDSTVFFQYFTNDNARFLEALTQNTTLVPALKAVMLTLQIADPETLTATFPTLFYGVVVETAFALGNLAACFVTIRYLSQVPFSTMFKACLVGNGLTFLLFLLFPLGQTSAGLLVGIVLVSGFVYMTAVLTVVGYAGARTPHFGQAAIFAFLMGMSNLGQQLGVETFGSWAYAKWGQSVTEGEGVEAVTRLLQPDQGFSQLAFVALGHLMVLWLIVKGMERKGYIDLED